MDDLAINPLTVHAAALEVDAYHRRIVAAGSYIGFDRLGSLLDTLGAFEGDTPSYPPYNIERVGENEYRISMAVAGLGENDLSIEVKENTLSIRGEKQAEVEQSTYLHRGIAGRSFERRFQLADHVEVKGARFENGLLIIDLVRMTRLASQMMTNAAIALHDHLATTANNISKAMGGKALFELRG